MIRWRIGVGLLVASLALGCGPVANESPGGDAPIVLLENNTDWAVGVRIAVNGTTTYWVVPAYEAWQLAQIPSAEARQISVLLADECKVIFAGDLPNKSAVVEVDPGIPTAQEPFSRALRVFILPKGSLVSDEVLLEASADCTTPT